MSTYKLKAIYKPTGAVITVQAIDDYFGRHQYGYKAPNRKRVMSQKTFDKFYEKTDEQVTANVLDAIAAMTNDDAPESLEDVQAREFIITDSCAWEANRKAGAFHPHSIEVVDTVTGQIRHIASGAKIKFVEGGITSSRTQAEYNHMHKE